ncbi:MAG: hypothetical protein FJ398_21740 [Verrucomicrobia bacterium]|nr:hypothetical protein [Verrucomicrobiota bacterium]
MGSARHRRSLSPRDAERKWRSTLQTKAGVVVLLSLLNEGRLTDRLGRATWFRSALVILTSNLGANAPSSAGLAADAGPDYGSEVTKFFRPEFFGPYSPRWGCSDLAALATAKIPRRRTPRNFRTRSEARGCGIHRAQGTLRARPS